MSAISTQPTGKFLLRSVSNDFILTRMNVPPPIHLPTKNWKNAYRSVGIGCGTKPGGGFGISGEITTYK